MTKEIYIVILACLLLLASLMWLMAPRAYLIITAYAGLVASILILFVSSIILIIIFIDVIFRVGFGYPSWSIVPGILLVIVGAIMTKGALRFLKKVRSS
jgi:hypothetical protein